MAVIAAVCCLSASPAYALDAGKYVSVRLVEPAGQARDLVILFSDRKGLSKADDNAAQSIAKLGVLVAEIDSRIYLRHLDRTKEKCHWLVYDAELLSRQLQRERHFPKYLTPIVAGIGEGGALAEMNLLQAPSATIAGAVSIDPSAAIASKDPICSNLGSGAGKEGFRHVVQEKLPGFWSMGLTHHARRADRAFFTRLHSAGEPLDLHEMAEGVSQSDAMTTLIEPRLAKPQPAAVSTPASFDISSLPLDELPVDRPSKLMAIILSGDGGWRDLDKTIAEDLQQRGIPVVGLDCLRYFWSKKTPAQTTELLAALIETYMRRWHADKVALIGYSFGADVIPFAYNRLPPDLRDHVALISLLGLSRSADFEISVRGWLGEPPGPDALPVLPQADKIPSGLIQCFYGQDETDTACPALKTRGVQTFPRSGGHHYDGNYGPIADAILTGFKDRAASSPDRN